jgi:4-carboxymuconolactone decarboxylase
MLCALNRPHELRIHLTGAINNGCTADEIRERRWRPCSP